MVFKARRGSCSLLFSVFFLISLSSGLNGEDQTWKGPVPIPEFTFDVLDIYYIGWSPRGRFAYGTSSPGEGGGLSWQWYVQDLVDDTILYTSPQWTLMNGQTPAELWDLHPEWHSQLIRFDIKPEAAVQQGERVFKLGGQSYSLDVEMDRSETSEAPGGLTHEITIRFYRNYNSAKSIYDYKPDPAEEFVDDMILKGYIKNPNEERIAVVALEKSGPSLSQSEWKYRVFGAHLNLGFSPVVRKGSELAEAVLNGQFYVSRLYLQNGADPEEKDARGYTALLLASRRALWDIAALLLEAGADPDRADDLGRTPLHYAVADNADGIVELLLRSGADPDRKDGGGLSARQEAAIKGNPAVMSHFRK